MRAVIVCPGIERAPEEFRAEARGDNETEGSRLLGVSFWARECSVA